jgi:hypothetical protein
LGAAHAEQSGCDPSLFKDYDAQRSSTVETFAILDIIDESNFSQFRQKFTGNVVIPIDGVPVDFGTSYSSFNQKRSDLHRRYQSNYSKQESQASLRIKFSAESSSSYRACLDAFVRTQVGLHLWANHVSDDGVTVVVKFTSPPGDARSLDIAITRSGSPSQSFTLLSNGSRAIPMTKSAAQEVRIVANGGGYHDDLFIPKKMTIKRVEPRHVQMCSCTGQGGVLGVVLWQPKGTLGGGLWKPPATEDCQPENMRVGQCVGLGGVNGVHLWGPEGETCGGLWPDRRYEGARSRSRLCSCKGRGGVDGVTLWGPEGEFCGGIWPDETYSADCRD